MAGSASTEFDILYAVEFLWFGDLLNLRVAGRRAGASLVGGRTWAACARKELPGFEFSCDHFDQPQRRQTFSLVSALIKGMREGPFQLTCRSKADIHQLGKLVRDARQAATSHCSLKGGTASYLVAHVRFLLAAQPGSTAFSAEPVSFPDVKGIGGMGALHLHFALQGGMLLVAARRDGLASECIKVRDSMSDGDMLPRNGDMSLDISSVDPDVMMHYRGLPITMGGPYEEAFPGIMSFAKGGGGAASDALVRGVLCVFCVRSGRPKDARPVGNYLNLDARAR